MTEQPKYSPGEELMANINKKFDELERGDKTIAVAELIENEAVLKNYRKNKGGNPNREPSEEEKELFGDVLTSLYASCDEKNVSKIKQKTKELFEEYQMRDVIIKSLEESLVKSAFTPRYKALEKVWNYFTENF